MKHSFLTLLFAYAITVVIAQNAHIDSLKKVVYQSKNDTNRVNLYSEISRYYNYKYPDSVLHYASKGLALAKRLSFKKGEIDILTIIGEAFSTKGNFPKAMEIKLQAMKEAEKLNDSYLISSCQNYLGALYIKIEDYQKALLY